MCLNSKEFIVKLFRSCLFEIGGILLGAIDESIFASFISPWGLPNESIPISLTWSNDFDFHRVRITLPDDLDLIELINVEDFEKEKGEIVFSKNSIYSARKGEGFPNYFGLVLKTSRLDFLELKLFKDIKIRFLDVKDSLIVEKKLIAKIFRPILINKTVITPKKLTDEINNYESKLELEYRGFGLISTRSEVKINQICFEPNADFRQRVQDRVQKVVDISDDEELKKLDVESFFKFLDDYEKSVTLKEKSWSEFMQEIAPYSRLFVIFMQELTKELHITYQSQNVILNSPILKIPHNHLNEKIVTLEVFIFYKDLVENVYEPTLITIPIEDYRSKPQETTIDFQIVINPIIDNPFKDVEKEGRE